MGLKGSYPHIHIVTLTDAFAQIVDAARSFGAELQQEPPDDYMADFPFGINIALTMDEEGSEAFCKQHFGQGKKLSLRMESGYHGQWLRNQICSQLRCTLGAPSQERSEKESSRQMFRQGKRLYLFIYLFET